jgi:uncharacterized membrane protein
MDTKTKILESLAVVVPTDGRSAAAMCRVTDLCPPYGDSTMTTQPHLWAVGYDDFARAEHAREELSRLAGAQQFLILLDIAILVRHADGSYTLDRQPFSAKSGALGGGLIGFLAGLAFALPITGASIGAVLGITMSTVANALGIGQQFIDDVKAMLKPGNSAMLVLDYEGDMDVILHAIRGLGGTVLKTNVDVERAKLIQSTLLADSASAVTATGSSAR